MYTVVVLPEVYTAVVFPVSPTMTAVDFATLTEYMNLTNFVKSVYVTVVALVGQVACMALVIPEKTYKVAAQYYMDSN